MYLIRWKGYSAEEDSWIAKWELKHAKSALEDYKKLHASIFSSQSSPPPVLSVDVPVHCHRLCSFPSPAEHTMLVTTITDPHLAVPFNHYFDDECPFEALYKAYLQMERLGVIINSPFTTRNSITPTVKYIACDVQTQLQAELVSVMHQLGMTDFIIDLDRYLKELAFTQNLIEEAAAASKNSTPSASLSPLTKKEEVALTCTKIWWTGSDHDISLACDHSRYHETCFQCRKLSHIHVNCHLYKCPPVSGLPPAISRPIAY